MLFVLGGIGGALCDQLHTQLGVLHYPKPVLFGQAWWVAPLFGAGTIVFYTLAVPFVRRAQGKIARPAPATLAIATAFFLGAYLASCLFDERALAAVFLVTWAARMAFTPARAETIVYSILLAVLGSSFEAALSSTGAFVYDKAAYTIVPLWLPGLYMHGAPLGLHLVALLEDEAKTVGSVAAAART